MNYSNRKTYFTRSLLAAAGIALFAGAASAANLRIASCVPPKHPAHDPLYTSFAELLSS